MIRLIDRAGGVRPALHSKAFPNNSTHPCYSNLSLLAFGCSLPWSSRHVYFFNFSLCASAERSGRPTQTFATGPIRHLPFAVGLLILHCICYNPTQVQLPGGCSRLSLNCGIQLHDANLRRSNSYPPSQTVVRALSVFGLFRYQNFLSGPFLVLPQLSSAYTFLACIFPRNPAY